MITTQTIPLFFRANQGTEISVHRNANSATNFAGKHEMFSKLVGSSGESKCTGPDVPSDQGQSVLKQPNSQLLELHSKQRNDSNMYSCYNFVYLNIARLLLNNGKNKSKISFLADIFNEHTLFCGLCETFLHSDITY